MRNLIVYTYFKSILTADHYRNGPRQKKQSTGYRNIMHNQPEYNAGFTLIELMVTIAIAAILLGIAIPSFTDTIASNRLTTSANELVTALNLARSESVKRGVRTTLCKSTDGSSCVTTDDWSLLYYTKGDSWLFNLKNDPGQEKNVISRHPEVAKELHHYLLEFMKEKQVPEQYQATRRTLMLE